MPPRIRFGKSTHFCPHGWLCRKKRDVAYGSKGDLTASKRHFRFAPESGRHPPDQPCPFSADCVAKLENRTTPKNLAKVDFCKSLSLQRSIAPIRGSVVVFAQNDVVPHVSACETHQRSLRISFVRRKRLLQHNLPKPEVVAARRRVVFIRAFRPFVTRPQLMPEVLVIQRELWICWRCDGLARSEANAASRSSLFPGRPLRRCLSQEPVQHRPSLAGRAGLFQPKARLGHSGRHENARPRLRFPLHEMRNRAGLSASLAQDDRWRCPAG